MKKLRNRVDVWLVTDAKKYQQLVLKPSLVAVRKTKVLTLRKPTYVGMHILELSKSLMYDFHCNMKNNMLIKLSYYLQIKRV